MDNVYGNVVEVVSRYVPLAKQDDKRYKGTCPFCGKDSLLVNEQGFFYCETCKTGGNAPKFLSLMEKINYLEACNRLGVSIATDDEEISSEAYFSIIAELAGDKKIPAEKRLNLIQGLVKILQT